MIKLNKLMTKTELYFIMILILGMIVFFGVMTEESFAATKSSAKYVSIFDGSDSSGVKEKVGDYYIWIEQGNDKYKLKRAKNLGVDSKTITSVARNNSSWMFESIVTDGNTIFYAKIDKKGKMTIYKTSVKGGEGTKVKSVKQLSHLVGFYNGKLYYNTVTGKGVYELYSYDISKKKAKKISGKCYTYSANGKYIICLNDRYYNAQTGKFVKVSLSDEGRSFYTDGTYIYYWEDLSESNEESGYLQNTGQALKKCSMNGKKVKTVKAVKYTDYDPIHFGSGCAFLEKADGKLYKLNYATGKLTLYVPSLSKPKFDHVKSSGPNSITLQWEKVDNAGSYQVYRASTKNGTYKLIKTTTQTSVKNTGLTTGKTYYYKVRAVKGDTKSGFSVIKSAKPILGKPKNVQAESCDNGIKISWNKVSGATGYEVYRATVKKGKYKKIRTVTECSIKDTGLELENQYYYKVRAYKIANGKTKVGQFSNVVTCKSGSLEDIRAEMLRSINEERQKAGVKPLKLLDVINETAQIKAKDMYQTENLSHYSLNLGTFMNQFAEVGVYIDDGGENIALGQINVKEAMSDWMNSDGHRENILNDACKYVGIGYYKGYWVQQFADTEKVLCDKCDEIFFANGGNTIYSEDKEGNRYPCYICSHCKNLMEKCPQCDSGYFKDVGITKFGSKAGKCDVCGHLQNDSCIEFCPSCNAKVLDNNESVWYSLTFDSTASYGKGEDNYYNDFYFQQFLIDTNVCKSCNKYIRVASSRVEESYIESLSLLKSRVGTEENIFKYITWEKQVGQELIESNENGSSWRNVYEVINTPEITSLEQLLGTEKLI